MVSTGAEQILEETGRESEREIEEVCRGLERKGQGNSWTMKHEALT